MRYADIKSGRVNLTQREIARGWLSALPRDPSADPPDLAHVQLQPLPKEPAR